MKTNRACLPCALFLLLTPVLSQAGPVLIVGTPGDAFLATPSGPSPNLGGILLTFSNLTAFTTFSSYTSPNGITISSPDGIEVLPDSTQSNPNDLYDMGPGGGETGPANTTISVATGQVAIGVGIADSDDIFSNGVDTGNPVQIFLQPLGAGDVDLGPAFELTIPENTANPGNGYYVVKDTSPDIFGLQITESAGDSLGDYTGLAIADVQISQPEPATLLLLAGGIAVLAGSRRIFGKQ